MLPISKWLSLLCQSNTDVPSYSDTAWTGPKCHLASVTIDMHIYYKKGHLVLIDFVTVGRMSL